MHKMVDSYNAMKLNEFKGTFEVVAGNESDDGKFWMSWAIASEYNADVGGSVPAKRDNGKYRNVPIKVVLGDREQAVENLKWLLGQLESTVQPPEDPDPPSNNVPSDDVPF